MLPSLCHVWTALAEKTSSPAQTSCLPGGTLPGARLPRRTRGCSLAAIYPSLQQSRRDVSQLSLTL